MGAGRQGGVCDTVARAMSYNLKALADAISGKVRSKPVLQLAALAQEFGVDRHTLTRAVQEAGQPSFRQLHQGVILECALAMFEKHSNLSIKELAHGFGYSPRGFRRFVRQKTGHSPRALRRTPVALLLALPDTPGSAGVPPAAGRRPASFLAGTPAPRDFAP